MYITKCIFFKHVVIVRLPHGYLECHTRLRVAVGQRTSLHYIGLEVWISQVLFDQTKQ